MFGPEQGFLERLIYPLPVLEDKTPLSLLSSPAGLQKIMTPAGYHRASPTLVGAPTSLERDKSNMIFLSKTLCPGGERSADCYP